MTQAANVATIDFPFFFFSLLFSSFLSIQLLISEYYFANFVSLIFIMFSLCIGRVLYFRCFCWSCWWQRTPCQPHLNSNQKVRSNIIIIQLCSVKWVNWVRCQWQFAPLLHNRSSSLLGTGHWEGNVTLFFIAPIKITSHTTGLL